MAGRQAWRARLGAAGAPGRVPNDRERIACIVNPQARAGRVGARIDELRRALDRGFTSWSVHVTEGPGHAVELAREAIEAGADLLASVGGDGTANEVVNGCFDGRRPRRPEVVFTLIPWGTGGDLARSLEAPAALDDAIWMAAAGTTLPADAGHLAFTGHDGEARTRIFLNVAGFGANGDVVSRANRSSKRLGGRLTFLGATLGSLLHYRPGSVEVRWDGPDGEGSWSKPLLSAFVANGGWCGGGMLVGKGGSIHDGVFDLTLLPPFGLAGSLARSWRLYDGSMERVAGVRRARATRLQAHAMDGSVVLLDVDGEQPGRLPLSAEILPGAIRVRGGWMRSPARPET